MRRYLLVTAFAFCLGCDGSESAGDTNTQAELTEFESAVTRHTLLHEDLRWFFDGFPRDAHPMAVLSSAVSALSSASVAGSRSSSSATMPRSRRATKSVSPMVKVPGQSVTRSSAAPLLANKKKL